MPLLPNDKKGKNKNFESPYKIQQTIFCLLILVHDGHNEFCLNARRISQIIVVTTSVLFSYLVSVYSATGVKALTSTNIGIYNPSFVSVLFPLS